MVIQEDCPSITHQPVHWERSFWQHWSQLVVVPEPANNWMWLASWGGWLTACGPPLTRASGLMGAAGGRVAWVHASLAPPPAARGHRTGMGTGRHWWEGPQRPWAARGAPRGSGPPTSCVVSRSPLHTEAVTLTRALGLPCPSWGAAAGHVSPEAAPGACLGSGAGSVEEPVFHPLVSQPSAKCYREGRRRPLRMSRVPMPGGDTWSGVLAWPAWVSAHKGSHAGEGTGPWWEGAGARAWEGGGDQTQGRQGCLAGHTGHQLGTQWAELAPASVCGCPRVTGTSAQ